MSPDMKQERQRKLAPAEEDLQRAARVLSEVVRFAAAIAAIQPGANFAAEAADNAERLERVATWLRQVVQSWHWGEPLAPRVEVECAASLAAGQAEIVRLMVINVGRASPAHAMLFELALAAPPAEDLRAAVAVLRTAGPRSPAELMGNDAAANVSEWLMAFARVVRVLR